MKYTSLVLFAVALLVVSCHHQEGPSASERIFDHANLLTDAQEDSLMVIIRGVDKGIGPQIAIITVDSLVDQNIGQFALTELKNLKLGRKGFDDGLLITVALKEKQIRIDPGPGLRRVIPDDMQSVLIRNTMAPEFKNDRYFQGLSAAIRQMQALMEENRNLIGVPL